MINITGTQGLAAFFNRVQNKSIWGKVRKTNRSLDVKSRTQVEAVIPRKITAEESTLSIPNSSHRTDPSFDMELYRQEMTDLVYQRSMQRMFSS